ncbi:MAG: SurA N-terminal domain-containing protein [Sulfuricella sp.]|nr:SurA N-terminal domain-containing protein [Sulfuricella sp.]
MLDVIRERAQSWFAKLILALITIPFALWGVDSYLKQGADSIMVAKVDGQKITKQEFNQVLKEQQERMRAAMGPSYDPAMMDKPEIRGAIADNLIELRLLSGGANKVGIVVPDEMLAKYIGEIPEFQDGGQFVKARYEAFLRNQGMTAQMFEMRLRQALTNDQFKDGPVNSMLVSHTALDNMVRLSEQRREIVQAVIQPEQFMTQVKVAPEEVAAYYEKHKEEFRVPEQARLEYVVLSVDDLVQQMSVSDEEIKKYYDEHAGQFQEQEQRQASHILIAVASNASEADKSAARAKAEKLFKEAKQSPSGFADLAKRNSQDPGSADKGGDLGMFARGAMVKPFDDAVFKMNVGDVVGPVQSDFGFHIIKLAAIKAGKARTLAETHEEIALELEKQKAGKRFAEVAETFSNTAYEQPDSLKPVADALKLKVQSSSWVTKNGGDVALLNNAKLLQAIFGEEALKLKRNTEAVEVRPNTLVSARVLEFRPATYKPMEELAAELNKRIQREAGETQAGKQGKEALESLRQGKEVAELKWGAPIVISRLTSASLGQAAQGEIFRADAGKLPAFVGVANPKGGYLLIKVNRVLQSEVLDEAKKKSYVDRLRQMLAQEYSAAFIAGLKKKAEITIKKDQIEKADK